jgi:hypothetical protein
MSTHVSPYTGTLAQCMLNYQRVEESLRFCLYRIQTLIKFRLVGIQPYEIQMKQIDDAALGRLIEMFKPLSDNEALIKQLRLIKNHRDLCAHQGFFVSDDKQQQEAEQDAELDAFLSEAETCQQMLGEEMQQVEARLQQEYQRLKAEQALPDIDIVPPLA